MDTWMDRCRDGMNRWKDEWLYGWTERCVDRQVDEHLSFSWTTQDARSKVREIMPSSIIGVTKLKRENIYQLPFPSSQPSSDLENDFNNPHDKLKATLGDVEWLQVNTSKTPTSPWAYQPPIEPFLHFGKHLLPTVPVAPVKMFLKVPSLWCGYILPHTLHC